MKKEFHIYSYHSYEQPYSGGEALFHFTKSESFFKIMEDLTLLLSSFEKLNDLNDGNIYNMGNEQ